MDNFVVAVLFAFLFLSFFRKRVIFNQGTVKCNNYLSSFVLELVGKAIT